MNKFKINWTTDLNETELAILLEEWEGFFQIKLVEE